MKKLNFFRKLGEKTKSSDQNESQTPPNQAENPYSQRISANQDAYEQNTKLQMASGPGSFQSSQHAPTWGAAQTTSTLPAYSPPRGSAPYFPPQGSAPSYRNSPNLSTGSPNPSETSPSFSNSPKPPAYSSGYGNQALGARNNIGRHQRFEDSNQQQSPPMPRQSPGQNSWGGFDDPNRQDLLPSGYGPPKPTPGPPYSQGGPSDGMPGADGGQEELTPEQMTPQQWENYQLSITREETERIRHATVDKSDELVMRSGAGRQMAKEIYANLNIQQNHIDNIEANINKAEIDADIAGLHTTDLEKVNGSILSSIGDKSRVQRKMAGIDNYRRAGEQRWAEKKEEARGWHAQTANSLTEREEPRKLGGNKVVRTDFMMEDDDGTQEAAETRLANNMQILEDDIKDIKRTALAINGLAKAQIKQLERTTEQAEVVGYKVNKEKGRLDNQLK